MKKFLAIFILGLALLAVSCSAESTFLKTVAGESYTISSVTTTLSTSGSGTDADPYVTETKTTTVMAEFSGDGKILTYTTTIKDTTVSDNDVTTITYVFIDASSSTVATYSGTSGTVLVTIGDDQILIV